jgi:hypothetical protein
MTSSMVGAGVQANNPAVCSFRGRVIPTIGGAPHHSRWLVSSTLSEILTGVAYLPLRGVRLSYSGHSADEL